MEIRKFNSKLLLIWWLSTKIVHCLPSLTSASFINSFERILLEWNANVYLSEPYRNCASIVDDKTLSLLGTAPTCVVQSYRTSTIIPGIGAGIKTGDTIGLNKANFNPPINGAVIKLAEDNSVQADQASPIDVVLKGPGTYCPCKDAFLFFNVDMSTHACYGKMLIDSWYIKKYVAPVDATTGGGEDETSNEDEEMTSEPKKREAPDIDFPLVIVIPPSPPTTTSGGVTTPAPPTTTVAPTQPQKRTFQTDVSRQKHALDIKLNSSLLENNGSYVLSVRVKNAFGNSKKITLRLMSIENCTVLVDVVRGSQLYRYENNIFYIDVTYPPCWMGARNSTFKFYPLFATGSLDSGSFMYSRTATTWLARARAYNASVGDLSGLSVEVETETATKDVVMTTKAEVEFTMTSQPLSATMFGDYMECNVKNKFLNSYLFDTDMEVGGFTYTEECSHKNGKCEGELAGKKYTHKLTFRKGQRIAHDSIDVKYVDTSMPSLSVFPSKKSFSPEEDVLFSAIIAGGSINGNVTYSWTCYDKYEAAPYRVVTSGTCNSISEAECLGIGAQLHPAHEVKVSASADRVSGCYWKPTNTRTKYYYNTLTTAVQCDNDRRCLCTKDSDIIPAEVVRNGTIELTSDRTKNQIRIISLTLPGNQILFGTVVACKCQLSYNGDTVTGIGSAAIEIPLQNTVLNVLPLSGSMMETRFRAHAHDWTSYVSNKPLLFRFGYTMDAMSRVRYLSPWTSKNSIENVYFPLAGAKEVNYIDLRVEILNAKKSISYLNQTIKLYKPAPTPKMSPPQYYLKMDQFKATQYLYNLLSLSDDVTTLGEKPDDEINLSIVTYLDGFLSSPVVSSAVENVIDFLSYFVEVCQGKLESNVLGRVEDVIDYIGNETEYISEIDYIGQSRAILDMVNVIVKDEPIKKSIFDVHTINKMLSTYTGRTCDLTLKINHKSNKTFTIDTPLIEISAYRDNQISTNQMVTVFKVTENQTNEYSKQYCTLGYGCYTYCLTDIRYQMDFVIDNAKENGTYVTDFHDLRRWRVGVFGRRSPVEVEFGEDVYDVNLPVTNKEVKFAMDDEVQCVLKDLVGGEFVPDWCTGTLIKDDSGLPETVECKCSQLGFIGAVKPWKPPPVPGPDVNVSFHFWDGPDRCTQRLYPTFKSKFIAAFSTNINAREKYSNGTLQMKRGRIRMGTCTPAEMYNNKIIIIVNLRIIDDITELRNIRIAQIIKEFIHAQTFKVQMAQVAVPMFDPNQTTPKPPPPTIPPIGEVGVSWMPIIVAIVVIFIFFILLAILSCIYHSYLLKKEVFNEMNSNKPEPVESEDEEAEDEKAKEEVMANIMEDVEFAGDKHTNKAHKISQWRMRYTKQVHPADDGSTQHSSTSDYYHESAMLDNCRVALDDSSDEEGSRPTSSRAELFRAQSIQVQNEAERKESTITQVEC